MAHINYPAYLAVLCSPASYNSGPLVLSGFTRNEAIAARMLFYSYRTHLSRQRSLSPLKQEELAFAKTITVSIRQEDQLYSVSYCPVEFLNTGFHAVTLAGLSNLGLADGVAEAPILGTGDFTTVEEPEDETDSLSATIDGLFGRKG